VRGHVRPSATASEDECADRCEQGEKGAPAQEDDDESGETTHGGSVGRQGTRYCRALRSLGRSRGGRQFLVGGVEAAFVGFGAIFGSGEVLSLPDADVVNHEVGGELGVVDLFVVPAANLVLQDQVHLLAADAGAVPSGDLLAVAVEDDRPRSPEQADGDEAVFVGLHVVGAGAHGLVLFAVVYAGMIVPASLLFYFILFFIYGIYAASSESISKAWITNIVAKDQIATAIGTFMAFNSIFMFLASTLAGLIWVFAGAKYTFALSAGAAVLIAIYMIFAVPYHRPVKD